jgi:hypothetical protein
VRKNKRDIDTNEMSEGESTREINERDDPNPQL